MIVCTRRPAFESGGVIIAAYAEVAPEGAGRFLYAEVHVNPLRMLRDGDRVLACAEEYVKAKLQEALDAHNSGHQPSGPA